MRARHWIPATLALVAAGSASGAHATEPNGQPPWGPRAVAMGGAYTAIADDASALHWNPAGLCGIDHQEIAVGYAALYDSDLRDSHLALAVPLSRMHALAFGWYRSGLDDAGLTFAENRLDVAYAIRPHSRLAMGTTARLLTRTTGWQDMEVQDGRGFGLDLGILFIPKPRWRAGLVAQNLFGAELQYAEGGTSEQVYDPVLRVGLAGNVTSWLTSSLDLDDRLHLGAEFAPIDGLVLRAGIQDESGDGVSPVYAVGAGFRIREARIDVASEMHPDLGNTHHLGLAYGFQLNPSRVRVERVEAEDLYASLARSYATNPFGRAWIRNLDDEEIVARVAVRVPGVLDAPAEQELLLRPRVLTEVDLTAVFPDGVVRHAGDREVRVEVTASYRSARVIRNDRGSGRTALYRAGAVNWARGTDQIGAFVTAADPVVEALAREAVRALSPAQRSSFGTRDMATLAALVTVLSTMELRYIPDPNNPYSSVSTDRNAVDDVRYPRDTLNRGSGDCDDTVVLLASLLENVGVETRVVDVPGHMFLLADSGIRASNREALLADSSLVVVADGRVWIPLETTALGGGFREVWSAGARTYRSWQLLNKATLVDVAAARRRYQPMESALPSAAPVAVDVARLATAVTGLCSALEVDRRTYLETRHGRALAGADVPPQEIMAAARALYLSGRLNEARALLEKLEAEAPSPQAKNNLAIVHLALAETAPAGRLLQQALEESPQDPGVWFNLGLLRYLEGDVASARAAIGRALGAPGGLDVIARHLELDRFAPASRGGGIELTLDKIRSLVQSAFGVAESEAGVVPRVPTAVDTSAATRNAETDSRATPGAGIPVPVRDPAAPEVLSPSLDLMLANARADEPARVQHYLYWKDR